MINSELKLDLHNIFNERVIVKAIHTEYLIDTIHQYWYIPPMKYMTAPEMALLTILSEGASLSGYDINKIIDERGFREWAGIGSTSIYSGLKKLEKKNFIKLIIDSKKSGKGPLPNKFKITKQGMANLKTEIKLILSSEARKDSKFDIALASIIILDIKEIDQALNERKEKLEKVLHKVRSGKFEKQGGLNLPPHVVLLFERNFMLLKTEIDFIEKALKDLN